MNRPKPLLITLIVAMALLVGACADDSATTTDPIASDNGQGAATSDTPDGTYLLVRYQVDEESPGPTAGDQEYLAGTAAARLWELTPTCDEVEPCDLTLSGGREDGEYSLDGFELPDLPPPNAKLTAEDGSWRLEEESADYFQCIQADGSYSTDFLLDAVITDELTAVDGPGVLRGTRTETTTLNEAGKDAGVCVTYESGEPQTSTYGIVAVRLDETGVNDEDVRFEGEYSATIDVIEETGTVELEPFTTFLQAQPFWDSFSGRCGPDSCSATFGRAYPASPDEPIEIELENEDGVLVGTTETTGACFDVPAGPGQDAPLLTEEGYTATTEVENRPVWVEDGLVRVSVTHFVQTLEPTPEAARTYPDACGTTETNDYWYYQVSTDLLP